jgi:hypothetical protein
MQTMEVMKIQEGLGEEKQKNVGLEFGIPVC